MSESPCIYCGCLFNPALGEGDHILPSALFGEFAGDVRFRGCCNKCNNSFSPFEQILAQSTPLGYFRCIVKPIRRRRQSGLRQGKSKGSKQPQFIVWAQGHSELVEPLDDPRNVKLVDRLTIQDKDGSEYYIRYFPGMSADRLRADLQKCGSKNAKRIYCSCDESHYGALRQLVEEVFDGYTFENRPDTEVGETRVRGRTIFEFSTDAFRGLAKIAFHYYLVHNQRGYRGNESQFCGVRRFITEGGECEEFFDRPGPGFALPFGETSFGGQTTPANWCHIFAAHEVDKNIVVSMRFFAGPGFMGEPHQVTLGRIPSKIVCPDGFWGHVYEYERNRHDSFAGSVTQARLARLK